ncbi:probable malonyl-CoA-acyl carrier protein transacylase, mitochondrial [Cephus cinctus]|uniref:Probable malonyl-CoA-acyl carrier protein transacylase, mitochondrial n=1 Tax=Cephus cinctus TaxID=211228 RepID=A0AAJ7C6P1_CEPCN|nr:probable malonyl-CoA-acyl carrier protein transacylase, mitochondrial [Cephus cinctus]
MLARRLQHTVLSNLCKISRCRLIRSFSEDGKKDGPQDNEPEISKLLDDAANFNEANDTQWATTPYPEGASKELDDLDAPREKLNPRDSSLILFPGQGILKVGDVKEYMHFPAAKELFEIAKECLGYDLLKICLRGPQEKLDRTEYNQPATVVASLAALEKLREERPQVLETCRGVAGYSVGELTALIFSGAMCFEDGIRLVGVRAAAMQKAASQSPQGMIFAYCTQTAEVSSICQNAKTWAMNAGSQIPECSIAIYLYTQAKIFGGCQNSLLYVEENASKMGLRKLKRLPVSGAFHTSLMAPAQEPLKKAIRTIEYQDPIIPVYSNVTAKPYTSARKIPKNLLKQLVRPVKWEQIMHNLYARPPGTAFPRTFDVGSKGSLKAILKQVNAKAWDNCIVV